MHTICTCIILLQAIPERNSVCVPQGLCTNAGRVSWGGGIITDNRGSGAPIVVKYQSECPVGEMQCEGVTGGEQCGRRYITNLDFGSEFAVNGAYPWQAYIRNRTVYTGSGVLIDATHILTAAFKTENNNPSDLQVYMGVFNPFELDTKAVFRQVTRICKAPAYLNDGTYKNDIALLTLETPILLGYRINVGTGCLATPGSSFVGQRCTVAGWGQTRFQGNDAPTSRMKQVQVPVVSFQQCQASMAAQGIERFLDVNELCAGGEEGVDACTQDGGAPLVCDVGGRPTVAGIVIWGKGCGRQGSYGVYADVSKYQQWIQSTLTNGVC